MSKRSYDSELSRALARPDIENLRQSLAVYYEWSNNDRKDSYWPDDLDIWFNWDDPDRSLALIMLALSSYDDEQFLGVVAAGLLEDTLCRYPDPDPRIDEIVKRVVIEARKSERFRWMLSGVWTNDAMNPDHVEEIKRVVGSGNLNNDPLPPRPWA